MSNVLPALRRALDILPSPEADRPGLLLRDPLGYAEAVLYVPPTWALALRCLDGEHTELDVQELLTRATGGLVFSDEVREFVRVLRQEGFLETEEFERRREQRHKEFLELPERPAAHAGSGYPASAVEIRTTFAEYFNSVEIDAGPPDNLVGVAAPHVSPEGGRNCYAETYRRLAAFPSLAERTFMVLGTSHWGAAGKFGLTHKPFVTPLGTLRVDDEMVIWLEQHGAGAVNSEDYCYAFEHSIEFQCVFLQYALGPELKIVPILCGPLGESPPAETAGLKVSATSAESEKGLESFLDALAQLAEKHKDRLFWVLGIDLTHLGRRYGSPFTALANQGRMAEVAAQDRRRLELVCAGDSRGFLELVSAGGDELNWCGHSTLYTFLRAIGQVRGRLLRYEQWNIDPQSVVSFASVEFFKP
ncbi:MAG: AmmeMemoRadiSam system protein B [Terriglobia bacterium]|jgi:AmmeMemoRadiSam system protein B